jgi:hypothetical protein
VHAETSEADDETVGSSSAVPVLPGMRPDKRDELSYKDSALRQPARVTRGEGESSGFATGEGTGKFPGSGSPYCNVPLREEVDCTSGNIVRYHNIGDVYLDGRHAIFTWENAPEIRSFHPGPIDFQAGARGVSVVDLRTGKVRSFTLTPRPGVYKTIEEIAPSPPHIVRTGFADSGAAYLGIGDDGAPAARFWFRSHDPHAIEPWETEAYDPAEHRLDPFELEAYEDELSGVRTFQAGTASATCQHNFASMTNVPATTRARLVASCVEHASQYLTIDASVRTAVQARTTTTCKTSDCLVQQFAGFSARCENAPEPVADDIVITNAEMIDDDAVSAGNFDAPAPDQYHPFEVALRITFALSANWFIGPDAQAAKQDWLDYFAAR